MIVRRIIKYFRKEICAVKLDLINVNGVQTDSRGRLSLRNHVEFYENKPMSRIK